MLIRVCQFPFTISTQIKIGITLNIYFNYIMYNINFLRDIFYLIFYILVTYTYIFKTFNLTYIFLSALK